MINFPIFNRLDVDNYGLFPGNKAALGLHIDFLSGLTLIVGANGLGKTTLITILYRLLTGPTDIPGIAGRSELGNINLESRRISGGDRRVFAERVSDGAATATATLRLMLGKNVVVIERKLSNLELLRFEVDDEEQSLDEVESLRGGEKQTINVRMMALSLVPIFTIAPSFSVHCDVADFDEDPA